MRYCRICAGSVIDDAAWVDLDQLGRFWLCPTHLENASFVWTDYHMGWLYIGGRENARLVLGPTKYEQANFEEVVA